MADREVRFAVFVENISRRLRPVCAHLSPDDFERLVHDMAEMQLRFSDRDDDGFGARFDRATGRIV